MKTLHKILIIMAIALSLASCGGKSINGKFYEGYGIADEEAFKNPNVVYAISAESVIWGILLCQTIVIPIYIVGWDLWKPVRLKTSQPGTTS
jgi:hypothetical protein